MINKELLIKGCGMEAKSPQRSEDLQCTARTNGDYCTKMTAPNKNPLALLQGDCIF